MSLLTEIRNAWGWVGINPIEVVGENDFGNLLVEDEDGRYWRICPEDAVCEVIAHDKQQLDELSNDHEFLEAWFMSDLVDQVVEKVGPLDSDSKYCLDIPSALGGAYEVSNIKSVTFVDLIRLAGDFGKQIRDLSDGAQKRMNTVDLQYDHVRALPAARSNDVAALF